MHASAVLHCRACPRLTTFNHCGILLRVHVVLTRNCLRGWFYPHYADITPHAVSLPASFMQAYRLKLRHFGNRMTNILSLVRFHACANPSGQNGTK